MDENLFEGVRRHKDIADPLGLLLACAVAT